MAAKWTFMVYMAGFNNLSNFATLDLDELRQVGSTKDVKFATFIKRLGKKSAQQLIVGKEGEDEDPEVLGNVDSGNPQTLLDFIRWAKDTAPAERYALVVWNHGSGWQPDDLDELYTDVRSRNGDTGVTLREMSVRSSQQISRAVFSNSVQEVMTLAEAAQRGIASDDGTGHSLDTVELGNVLEKGHEALGQPFDLLGMDACLMSTMEVAYQAREHVGAVVGSEELEPGAGWPYHRIARDLTENPDMDGADLGKAVVKRYIDSYEKEKGQWPVTQCAVRTEGLEPFADGLDKLGKALRTTMTEDQNVLLVQRAQSRSVEFTGDLVDIKTLCANLGKVSLGSKVEDAAKQVAQSLKPNGFVVAEGHRGKTVEGCGGVTAYLPIPGEPISKYYKQVRFAKEHGWDEFLKTYHEAVEGG